MCYFRALFEQPTGATTLNENPRVSGQADFQEVRSPRPRGIVAKTPEEAEKASAELGTKVTVVKAQASGGRQGRWRQARQSRPRPRSSSKILG